MTTRFAALLLVPLTWLSARAAQAEPPVPDVAAKDLPVAGTCAPLDAADVTRLLVGPTGLYRADGGAEVLDQPGLEALLARRAGGVPGRPGRHSVWVTVPATQVFKPLWAVLAACTKAGIFRLGLEVQSEQGGTGFGFPLFVPATRPREATAAAGPRGRRLEVMLDRWESAPSHPRRLFAAAKTASEKFAPVVAEVSLDVNLSVQHVVTCLDLLYRGGCVAVNVKFRDARTGRATKVLESTDPRNRAGLGDTTVPLNLRATIVRGTDRRDLGSLQPDVEVPPLAPRAAPWGDDGANAPGALALVLEDLPAGAGAAAKTEPDDEPLPSYAGRREGAPTTVVVAADKAVAGWATMMAAFFAQTLHRKFDPKTGPQRFVSRLRVVERYGALIEPVAQQFPSPQRVTPSTLRFDVYLVKGITFVGKVEVTLHVAGSAVSFIFAKWMPVDVPEGHTLPPPAADPFAAGVPGHVRVWLEAAFDTVYRQGAAGLPLAPVNEVLAQLPTVAQKGASDALHARGSDMELLAKWLAVTEYDRLVIAARGGTAAVHAEGRVAGILQYDLESEERDLRLVTLKGRAAPK